MHRTYLRYGLAAALIALALLMSVTGAARAAQPALAIPTAHLAHDDDDRTAQPTCPPADDDNSCDDADQHHQHPTATSQPTNTIPPTGVAPTETLQPMATTADATATAQPTAAGETTPPQPTATATSQPAADQATTTALPTVATPTASAVPSATMTREPTEAPTLLPTIAATVTPTSLPIATSTSVVLSPTPMPTLPTATATPIAPAPAACVIYGVHDAGLNDSQLFTIDGRTIHALGPLHRGLDIEGLAIHPWTRAIYGASSGHGHPGGHLYRVDGQTGAVVPVGATGFRNITELTFRPSDATLWGWAEGAGLVQIDPATGRSTVKLHAKLAVEGLTWDRESRLLYGSAEATGKYGPALWVIDPQTGTIRELADNLPGETEALAMRPDGRLLGGVHDGDAVRIFVYDLATLSVITSETIPSPYNDVEALAVPACMSILPSPTATVPPTPTTTPPPTTTPLPPPTDTPPPTAGTTSTPTWIPTATATSLPSSTPVTTPTTPTPGQAPSPSATPTSVLTPSPTQTPTIIMTAVPSGTPTVKPSPTPRHTTPPPGSFPTKTATTPPNGTPLLRRTPLPNPSPQASSAATRLPRTGEETEQTVVYLLVVGACVCLGAGLALTALTHRRES
jgi:hypothetical protein